MQRSIGTERTSGGRKGRPDESLLRILQDSVTAREDRLVRLRRRMHATPEASNDERHTTSLVADALRERGLVPRLMSDDIGLAVEIDLGAKSGTFIALRCELDAVGVNDDKQVPYASTHPGLCHACGHDVHTTICLATAAVLNEHLPALRQYEFRHNIRVVFQPAEENSTGARSMIQQGALDGVDGIFAMHVDPFLEVGRIGLRTGALTSACKSFEIVVRGRSGHTARPHEAIDPIPAATMVVDMIYQLAPRSVDCRYPMVVTVASINAGHAHNAIPDLAVVRGTMRAARLQELEAVQKRILAVTRAVGEATGCDVTLEFLNSSPATDNHAGMIGLVAEATEDLLGNGSVEWLEVPSLGGEDFAFYQELIPGAIVRLGAAPADERQRRPLHSSLFDVNESVLTVGTQAMTWTALRLAAEFTDTRT